MNLRRLFMLSALLALTACAGNGEKYPFPPQFVEAIPATVLAAPASKSSAQEKKEIAGILARQATITETEKATILAEDHISPRMILEPVLGTNYTDASHPALFTLLRHAASDAWRIGDATQDYWQRTRPWLADSRVQLLVSSIKRPSYPSGHSTTNHVWAHVLAELFPTKREALFARAYAIGIHRTEAGVHFPSDVVAGKKMAAIIYNKMRVNPAFKADLAAARGELKAPKAANDNAPRLQGCITPEHGVSMTMCR